MYVIDNQKNQFTTLTGTSTDTCSRKEKSSLKFRYKLNKNGRVPSSEKIRIQEKSSSSFKPKFNENSRVQPLKKPRREKSLSLQKELLLREEVKSTLDAWESAKDKNPLEQEKWKQHLHVLSGITPWQQYVWPKRRLQKAVRQFVDTLYGTKASRH